MTTDDTIDMDGPEMMPLDDPDEGHTLRDEDCGPGSDGYDDDTEED